MKEKCQNGACKVCHKGTGKCYLYSPQSEGCSGSGGLNTPGTVNINLNLASPQPKETVQKNEENCTEQVSQFKEVDNVELEELESRFKDLYCSYMDDERHFSHLMPFIKEEIRKAEEKKDKYYKTEIDKIIENIDFDDQDAIYSLIGDLEALKK